MALRISGIVLPNEKKLEVALTYLYGIGLSKSKKVMAAAEINSNIRVKELSEDEANRLRVILEKNEKLEGDLRREIYGNIKRLKEIKSYRGSRHGKNLPARGQRTKTNSRTVRGNKRMTMLSGRKPSSQKT